MLGLLALSFRLGLAMASGRPRIWLEKVLGHRPSTAGSAGPGGITPHPCLLSGAGFPGKRSDSSGRDRRLWWPRPGFRFHLTHRQHLISVPPPGVPTPPPPGPAPEEAELRAFEVREFQSQRSRQDLRCHPVGRGQQASVAGRGPPSPSPPLQFQGAAQIWRLSATLPVCIYPLSRSVLGKAFNSVITTLLKYP